jgi:hypothetical protein
VADLIGHFPAGIENKFFHVDFLVSQTKFSKTDQKQTNFGKKVLTDPRHGKQSELGTLILWFEYPYVLIYLI